METSRRIVMKIRRDWETNDNDRETCKVGNVKNWRQKEESSKICVWQNECGDINLQWLNAHKKKKSEQSWNTEGLLKVVN